MATPYTLRWLNAILDDPNLSPRAKVSAVPIFRHADMSDGRGCCVGTTRAAAEMSVHYDTMSRGWRELVEAEYLDVHEVASSRRRTQGAYRRPVFPTPRTQQGVQEANPPHTTAEPPAQADGTYPDRPSFPFGPSGPPGVSSRTASQAPRGGPPGDLARPVTCAFCGDVEVSCGSMTSARECGNFGTRGRTR